MQHTRNLSRQQYGQAAVEYIVVLLLLVAALFVPVPDPDLGNQPVINALADKIQTAYAAYSFAISVAE